MPTIRQTESFAAWFAGLRDRQAKARINVRIRRLSLGNPGQMRALSGGVAELKTQRRWWKGERSGRRRALKRAFAKAAKLGRLGLPKSGHGHL